MGRPSESVTVLSASGSASVTVNSIGTAIARLSMNGQLEDSAVTRTLDDVLVA